MKKVFKGFISIIVIVATLLSVSTAAFAASSVSSVDCQPKTSVYGGKSVYFYVKASSTTCKLNFTCGKGTLDWVGEGFGAKKVYGSYEVKIYKWDTQKGAITGSCLFDKDIYNKSSYTASFNAQKGCYYRVQVYFWNAKTTATSYKNKLVIIDTTSLSVGCLGDPNWTSFPTIKATNNSGCTLYKTNP